MAGGDCSAQITYTQVADLHVREGGDDWILRSPGRWWVLRTRARNEKTVARELGCHGAMHYLPLVRVHHTYAKSKASFLLPLFPGYVFLCGNDRDYELACQTKRVAQILHVSNQDQLRRELQHIHSVVESGRPVGLYPALRQGRRCRITSGALRGVEGVVIRRRGPCQMYIAATMLGQSAVIEVDAALLEAAD